MEQIKQEIINNVYQNGENLITGPILQEVLLDMVDDYNSKVSSGSVPGDLVEKTGSWDDAADWVEDNSGSLVHDTDLDGYATEQWVEDQGYLKEVPEGYATTESLNELSESVAELSSSIPSVDLSGYATTESVNEATQSVKDWVEAKHYLTTASLSGSVTEESVQFMINDSTASMKEWVENQNYATETFVSESIANLDIPDTSGFVTTQSYNQDSASFDERINSISGSDLSGYATTESLNQLSESVAEDLEGKADRSDLPDLTGYATEQWVQEQGYLTEHQDISGLATTESLNQVSSSLSESIAAISGSSIDLSGYVTTSSFEDLEGRVDVLEEDVTNLASARDALESAGIIEWNDESEEYTAVPLATSESVARSLENLTGEIADKANSRDLTSLSESVASDITSLSESIAAISGSDLSGYATTESLNQVSQSLSASIAAITGSGGGADLSGYATTASLISITDPSNSAALLLHELGLAYWDAEQWKPSFTGEIPDAGEGSWEDSPYAGLYGFLSSRLHLCHIHQDYDEGTGDPIGWYIDWDLGNAEWSGNPVMGLLSYITDNKLIAYEPGESQDPDQNDGQWISPLVTDFYGNAGISASLVELSKSVAAMSGSDLSGYVTTASYNTDSASFNQRIDAIVVPDLSEYATTASLNNVSQSLSASIAAISGSGADLSVLANPRDPNNPVFQALATASFAKWGNEKWEIDVPLEGEVEGNVDTYLNLNDVISPLQMYLLQAGLWKVNLDYDEGEDKTYWRIDTMECPADIYWGDNLIGKFLQSLGLADWDDSQWYSKEPEYFTEASASFDQRINNIITGSGVDLSGYATTSSVNSLSESVATDFANLNIPDVSGLATTSSLNTLSSSVNNTFNQYATTQSVTQLSQSISQSISQITGSAPDLSGYATTASLLATGSQDNPLFKALEQVGIAHYWEGPDVWTIELPEGGEGSLYEEGSRYPGLLRQLVESGLFRYHEEDDGEGNHSWYIDLNGIAQSGNPDSPVGKFFEEKEMASWDEENGTWTFNFGAPDLSNQNDPTLQALSRLSLVQWRSLGPSGVWMSASISPWKPGSGSNTAQIGSYATASGNHAIAQGQGAKAYGSSSFAQGVATNATGEGELAAGKSNFTSSGQIFSVGVGDVEVVSGSVYPGSSIMVIKGYNPVNQKNAISVITGSSPSASVYIMGVGNYDGTNPTPGVNDVATVVRQGGVDLSGYATTESVNNLSSSVGDISSSFADTIANLPTGSSGGDYLPLTGGTLTGNLKIDGASMGVGVNPGGTNCLAVGGSGTEANGAHNSVVVGENCHASVWNAFVAGRENVVEGGGAFGAATGFRCKVNSMAGYAGGCRSTASAYFATAIGFGVEARSLGQVVLGSYNEYDPIGIDGRTGSYAVIFGIGKSSTWNQDDPGTITRQNGLAIKWDGGLDINYSGSTITLQNKIAELEQDYATTESVLLISQSISQSIAEIPSNMEVVTVLTSGSTDTQVPSAKCVYDAIGELEAALLALR